MTPAQTYGPAHGWNHRVSQRLHHIADQSTPAPLGTVRASTQPHWLCQGGAQHNSHCEKPPQALALGPSFPSRVPHLCKVLLPIPTLCPLPCRTLCKWVASLASPNHFACGTPPPPNRESAAQCSMRPQPLCLHPCWARPPHLGSIQGARRSGDHEARGQTGASGLGKTKHGRHSHFSEAAPNPLGPPEVAATPPPANLFSGLTL